MRGEERARLTEVPSLIPSSCFFLQIAAQEKEEIDHDGDDDNDGEDDV